MPRVLALTLTLTTLLFLQGCSSILSVGNAEPIQENSGKRSTGAFIDDEIIEVKALVNLNKVDPALEQSHLAVTSFNGIVLLTGQVANQQLRKLAADTVAKIKRVRRVHNEITISGKTSMLARSNDGWLSTKVKSKMLANSSVEGHRIKVVTENGVVYLMGLVTKAEGDRAANIARETAGVQKVVRIFEYI